MSSTISKPTRSPARSLLSLLLLTLSLPILALACAANTSAQTTSVETTTDQTANAQTANAQTPNAQTPQPPSPALVARVTAAHKIFLSNAGADDSFLHDIPNGATASYNQLYAALQQWGYFQLVDTPAHADLIFQIRGAEVHPILENTISGSIIAHQHQPMLELSILDPHTAPHTLTPIDTLSVRAGRGATIPKGNIAFAQSIEYLTYQISTLVSVPRRTPGGLLPNSNRRASIESLLTAAAPVPPQVLNAKNVFVKTDAPPSDPYLKRFTADLTAWGYYHLVNTPEHADIIFAIHISKPDSEHDNEANSVSVNIYPPNGKTILWTLCDPHYGFYRTGGEKRVAALTQNLISTLKQLNHIPLTPAEVSALR